MSVIKFNRNFDTLFNWDTDANPTTQQDYQSAVQNWTKVEMDIVDTLLWQPETDYTEDNIVKTPSLPSHYVLKCTTGGTSGATEPSYENVQLNDSVTDGTVVWTVTKLTVASDIPVPEDKANINASNIGVNAETDNSESWGEAIGGGAVASGDKRLVTGDTVYAVTNSMANSISANTTAIATNAIAIATNTTNIATNTEAIAANATAIETNTANIEANTTAIETNADAIETNTVRIENVSESVATMGTRIDDNEALVEMESKRITNIEKLLQGNLYDYQTDNSSAYTKTVPAGAMPYAGLEHVGGKTLVWNQLCNATDGTKFGMVCSLASDGTYSIEGVNSQNSWSSVITIPITNHKYLIKCADVTNYAGHGSIAVLYNSSSADAVQNYGTRIFNNTNGTYSSINFAAWNNTNVKVSGKFTVFDLTLLFGAGNEPTTVEEFQQMFPADWYAYNEGELLSAGVTEVVSKKADTTTLATYPIPTAIRNLEGYGWSAGSVYNYVDFERKVFVQNVGSRAYASGDESNTAVTTDMTTTYYPLATPIETDISAYLTDDNLISVESGGTLTFPNSNGDDYRIPVPSDVTYMIDLQEALNNG